MRWTSELASKPSTPGTQISMHIIRLNDTCIGDQLSSMYFVNHLGIIVIQTGVLPVLRMRWAIYQRSCLVNSIRVAVGSEWRNSGMRHTEILKWRSHAISTTNSQSRRMVDWAYLNQSRYRLLQCYSIAILLDRNWDTSRKKAGGELLGSSVWYAGLSVSEDLARLPVVKNGSMCKWYGVSWWSIWRCLNLVLASEYQLLTTPGGSQWGLSQRNMEANQ